jgi:hypothetical protein
VGRTILKLSDGDEEQELQFDLEYLRSLTVEQRFEAVLSQSEIVVQMLLDRGHLKPAEIVKRA